MPCLSKRTSRAWQTKKVEELPSANLEQPPFHRSLIIDWIRLKMFTLLGTNISLSKAVLKMSFLFARWDMLIPWRVTLWLPVNSILNYRKKHARYYGMPILLFHSGSSVCSSIYTSKLLVGGDNSKIFYFHPEPWGDNPFWRAYFSDGLKPQTSKSSVHHGHHPNNYGWEKRTRISTTCPHPGRVRNTQRHLIRYTQKNT